MEFWFDLTTSQLMNTNIYKKNYISMNKGQHILFSTLSFHWSLGQSTTTQSNTNNKHQMPDWFFWLKSIPKDGLHNRLHKENKPGKKLFLKHSLALHCKDSPMQALLWISISGKQVPAIKAMNANSPLMHTCSKV